MNPQPTVDGLDQLPTERSSPGAHLERLGVAELVAAQVDHARQATAAVAAATEQIAAAIETIAERLSTGGRLIYVGAGTPGRLAILDAAECRPTFGVGAETVMAVIAGGDEAFTRAVEGAEDDVEAGAGDLRAHTVSAADVVVGVTASGRTPYVLGALREACAAGAATVAVVNNPHSVVAAAADHPIETQTGPEFVAGSTRLKAGTAQKLVLNMLSTTAMIRLGRVHDNLMVDVVATNDKLRRRGRRIVAELAGVDGDTADRALAAADGNAKVAVVSLARGVPVDEARRLLENADGHLDRVPGGDT